MKYDKNSLPHNAFLKIKVGPSSQRLFFKDVLVYKKITKRHIPHIPQFNKYSNEISQTTDD